MSAAEGHPVGKLLRDEELWFLGLAALVGIVGAAVGAAFQVGVIELSDWVFGARPGLEHDVVRAAAESSTWRRLLVPAIGGLAAGTVMLLLGRLFRLTGGRDDAGVSDVMRMLVQGGKGPGVPASTRAAAVAFVGIGTGGSAGREGPMIHIAAALAGRLARAVRLSIERQHVLVVAGVSTGLAAAYNAPIAATVFALEILALRRTRYILPCVVASTFSAATMALIGKTQPLYPVGSEFRQLTLVSGWDVPLLLALAIAGGVASAAFLYALRGAAGVMRRISMPAPIWLAIGGLGVGAIGCWLPWVYGNGYETVAFLVRDPRFTFAGLGVAAMVICAAKMAATASSVGSGLPGGVFTPTLVVGASLGAAVSALAAQLSGVHVPSALYVLVGMAVLLAGTMHAPFLAVVMVLELTGNLTAVLWLPIPAFLAVAISRRLCGDSIYVGALRRRGVNWVGDLAASALRSLRVRDIMRRDVPLLPAGLPAPDLRRVLAESRQHTLFVGREDGTFLGGIDMHDAKVLFATDPADIDGLVVAQDLAKPIPVVYPDDSLVSVNEKLWFRDLGHLPVLESREQPRFVGVVTRRDMLGVIDHEVLRRDQLVGRVQAPPGDSPYVELPPKHRLEEVPLPAWLVGKTLAEANLVQRFGITVVAVARRGPGGVDDRRPPSASRRLEAGDRLVVLGTRESITDMRAGPAA